VFAFGACTGITSTSASSDPEHVIEPAAEPRVSIADEEARPASWFSLGQQHVTGLLGDPGGVGISRGAVRHDVGWSGAGSWAGRGVTIAWRGSFTKVVAQTEVSPPHLVMLLRRSVR
jgi:hypothetical protein